MARLTSFAGDATPLERMHRLNPSAWPPISWCRFGCELATGDGAIPKEGEQGPEEVAKRPSQVPNGSAARIGRTQAGTSTRGAEGAERASGCVATRPEARVGSGGFQLNVTHFAGWVNRCS